MELAGTYNFEVPRQMVWDALQDPDVLGQIMPGGQKLEKTDENEYKARIKIRVGPVQGVFDGNIKLSEIEPPESYRMDVDGRGQPGFIKAHGNVKLEEDGDHTVMNYEGEAQVGGRIASVGQRLMDSTARAMTRQTLDGLHEYLKSKAAAENDAGAGEEPEAAEAPADDSAVAAADADAAAVPAATVDNVEAAVTSAVPSAAPAAPNAQPKSQPPKVEIKSPSQTEFAVGVAKNMLDDVIPPARQPLVFGIVGFLIGLLVGILAE